MAGGALASSAGVTLERAAAIAGLIDCRAMRTIFKTQNRAVTAAFFIAPLVPSLCIPLVGPWRFPPDVVGALLVYVIALPFVCVFGLPLFLLFSRIAMFSWWGAMLAGALAGFAIIALLGVPHDLWGYPLLLYVCVGAATGIAFWAVVMLGPEPNQSAARNWVGTFRRRRE